VKGKLLNYDPEKGLFQIEACVYEGGGGQPADRIKIKGPGFYIESDEAFKEKGGTFWKVKSISGEVPKTEVEVDVVIDELWRLEVSQQHTAQHIFSALAEQLYGWPSEGFAIFEDESKIELLGADEDPEKYAQLERQVNEVILRQIPVRVYVTEEVDEKLRKHTDYEHPRIVEIEGIDKCACGGTHVTNTGYVGGFAILKVERKNTRYVRVIFAAGIRLARIAKNYIEREQKLKNLLTGDVEERVFQLLEQKKQLELEKKNLLELVKVQIAQSDEVFWRNLPLDMQSMKQIAAYCNEKDKDIVLVNQEGYFAMGGPNANMHFEAFREKGASGGGKGVITGKLTNNDK